MLVSVRLLRARYFRKLTCPRQRTLLIMVRQTTPTRDWKSLNVPAEELRLQHTLPTGQSFRWRQLSSNQYIGVVGRMLVKLCQTEDDVLYDVVGHAEGWTEAACLLELQEYFNLHVSLREMSKTWSTTDARFGEVRQYIPGARVLRQNPVECLFQFICSSNNHISRILGMVERLCKAYGTPIKYNKNCRDEELDSLCFYTFPSLQQLATATEEELRADGFGYRAKFIVGSVGQLQAKPEGGEAWLFGLRDVPYAEASDALCTLPGVGPKVAACVCLFALDKHEAIPVDTHVWQLATRYYTPHLKGKSLTRRVMDSVEGELIRIFGPYAGWAHNTLFISELASVRSTLPAHLFPTTNAPRAARQGKTKQPKKGAGGGRRKTLSTNDGDVSGGDAMSGDDEAKGSRADGPAQASKQTSKQKAQRKRGVSRGFASVDVDVEVKVLVDLGGKDGMGVGLADGSVHHQSDEEGGTVPSALHTDVGVADGVGGAADDICWGFRVVKRQRSRRKVL